MAWIAPDKVIDGVSYIRVFCSELRKGEETALGETVERVEYVGQDRARIYMTNGYTSIQSSLSTMLVRMN